MQAIWRKDNGIVPGQALAWQLSCSGLVDDIFGTHRLRCPRGESLTGLLPGLTCSVLESGIVTFLFRWRRLRPAPGHLGAGRTCDDGSRRILR